VISENSWAVPSFPAELSSKEVHVWRLNLQRHALSDHELASRLSAEERRRATRIRFQNARKQFVVGRGVLRTILGFYLNTEPNLIEFYYGAHGKPYVEHGYGRDTFQFSLAHSHELVLYAFTRGRRLGIDIEFVRELPGAVRMLHTCFSERESAGTGAVMRNEEIRTFLESWTRQEAYVKAIGIGLAERFQLSSRTDRLADSEEPTEDDSGWSVLPFAPAPGFTGTLVVEGNKWRFHSFQFD
jgi:4'-phosphopantetheinyl transferase